MGGATYLAGLWVAKKVFAYGLGTAYGWPRVYRRLMEANAKVYGRRSLEYAKVRGVVQKGMRLPNEIGKAWRGTPQVSRQVFTEAMKDGKRVPHPKTH